MTDGSTQNPGLMAGSWDHWILGRSSGRPRMCASRIQVGSGTRSASGVPGAERTGGHHAGLIGSRRRSTDASDPFDNLGTLGAGDEG
jgi:hypothetical protein